MISSEIWIFLNLISPPSDHDRTILSYFPIILIPLRSSYVDISARYTHSEFLVF
jgi:hypothetical protein